MRPASFIAWGLLALPALGCGPVQKGEPKPKFALEGSLTVVLELGYDLAYLDLAEQDFSLRFARKKGEGEDTVLKVTAGTQEFGLEANVAFDLTSAVVSRDVLDDPRRTFPKLQRGRLIFDRLPNPGDPIRGDLAVTFENGTQFASGRTVFGKFEAIVP